MHPLHVGRRRRTGGRQHESGALSEVSITFALFRRHVWHAWVTPLSLFVRPFALSQLELDPEEPEETLDLAPPVGAGWMGRYWVGGLMAAGPCDGNMIDGVFRL